MPPAPLLGAGSAARRVRRRARRALHAGLVLVVAGCGGAAPQAPGAVHAVVVVTLDTTRLDALGAFGGAPGVTPNLDRLARESQGFRWARASAPITLPAHASMFTGLWPPRHTVRGNGPERLPGSALTLAERLRQEGWQTAAFVGSLALDRAFGLDQGFEVYDQPAAREERAVGEISERAGSAVVAAARAWLARRDAARPFFLWVHLFDPHAPYAAPEPFASRAPSPYLADVAAADHALGELLAERTLDLDETLLVIVGDHGEGLGEHGESTHALLCYDSTLRVPLLVRRPGGTGSVSDALVSIADVFPTVLDALGLALPAGLDGVALEGTGERAGERGGVYFESYQGWSAFGMSPLAGWVDREGKYIHASVPELFRPDVDPAERDDRIGSAGEELARYRAALAAIGAASALAPDAPAAVDEHLLARLAALGYAARTAEEAPPAPLAPNDRPSPQAMIAVHEDYERALALLGAGRRAEAIPGLERTLAALPGHVQALDALARARIGLEQWEPALAAALRRLALPPERSSTHRDLVLCYTGLGRPTEARRHIVRFLELMIEAYERRGEHERARAQRALLEAALAAGDGTEAGR